MRKAEPSTQSASEPATQGAESASTVDAEGYLQPVDPFEVRIRPKAYSGELTIVAAAANGSSVKSGDVLLQLDAEPLNRQLSAARNELTVAQANADHADAEAKLAAESDALAMRQEQDSVRQADDAVKWWETVDGPQMLQQTQLGVKETQAQVDDEQDELNQLKKMYKSEELTNATADIVVKRALRTLEVSQARLAMTRAQADKFKTYEYPIARQKPIDGQTSAHLSLRQLQLAQAQGEILRKAALVTSQAALDDARRKVADLAADAESLTVRAPTDGTVAYGPFTQGAFQADPKSLRIGEKVGPQQVLMTLYSPGKLEARVDLPEAKFAKLRPGVAAIVRSEAFPDIQLHGVCEPAVRIPSAGQNGPMYAQTIAIHDIDPRLGPGSRVKVQIDLAGDGNSDSNSKP